MGRPLPRLLAFFAIASIVIFLVQGDPLPGEGENVTIGSENTEFEATPVNKTASENILSFVSCVVPIGIFTGDGFVCDPIESLWSNTVGETAIGKAITTVTEGMGSFVRFMGVLLTFDVPGAPDYIRWGFSTFMIGTSAYIVISLVGRVG